jgi:nucleoside diphosphate kinase
MQITDSKLMVKATFTIIDDDEKAKRTEVIEMIYPMDKDRNFLKSLIEYLEEEEITTNESSNIITGH